MTLKMRAIKNDLRVKLYNQYSVIRAENTKLLRNQIVSGQQAWAVKE